MSIIYMSKESLYTKSLAKSQGETLDFIWPRHFIGPQLGDHTMYLFISDQAEVEFGLRVVWWKHIWLFMHQFRRKWPKVGGSAPGSSLLPGCSGAQLCLSHFKGGYPCLAAICGVT